MIPIREVFTKIFQVELSPKVTLGRKRGKICHFEMILEHMVQNRYHHRLKAPGFLSSPRAWGSQCSSRNTDSTMAKVVSHHKKLITSAKSRIVRKVQTRCFESHFFELRSQMLVCKCLEQGFQVPWVNLCRFEKLIMIEKRSSH